jgi:hypothetical protein
VLIAFVASGGEPTHAASPIVKTSRGFYRMMLGDFEVTALSDGVVRSTSQVLPTATLLEIKGRSS